MNKSLLITAAVLATLFVGIGGAEARGRGAMDPAAMAAAAGGDPMAALMGGDDEDSSPLADAVEAAGDVLGDDDGDDD